MASSLRNGAPLSLLLILEQGKPSVSHQPASGTNERYSRKSMRNVFRCLKGSFFSPLTASWLLPKVCETATTVSYAELNALLLGSLKT